jgi:hypothetical protein
MTALLTWLKYNWKWALPMAALGIFVPVTSCVLVTILLISFLLFRTSAIYKQALDAVRRDDQVIALVGAPVRPGLLVLGTFSRHTSGTMVNLTIPLYGPLGKATAFAGGAKRDGEWQFITLQVHAKGRRDSIDLLQSVSAKRKE